MINYLITHQRRTRCLKSGAWACAVLENWGSCTASHTVQIHNKNIYMHTQHAYTLHIQSSLSLLQTHHTQTQRMVCSLSYQGRVKDTLTGGPLKTQGSH